MLQAEAWGICSANHPCSALQQESRIQGSGEAPSAGRQAGRWLASCDLARAPVRRNLALEKALSQIWLQNVLLPRSDNLAVPSSDASPMRTCNGSPGLDWRSLWRAKLNMFQSPAIYVLSDFHSSSCHSPIPPSQLEEKVSHIPWSLNSFELLC